MGTSEKKINPVNLNTLLMFIAIGAIGWNGSATMRLVEKMSRVETLMEVRAAESLAVERRIVVVEGLLGVRPKP